MKNDLLNHPAPCLGIFKRVDIPSITIPFLTAVLLLIILTVPVVADDPPELKSQVGGTVQSLFSLDQNDDATNMGFGLRRVRFRYYAQLGKARLFAQAELTSPKLMDGRIEYHFNDMFNIRAGRFVGAGVRSGALTSHTAIDIVERSFSALQWASMTVGSDYRDYGVQLEGKSGDFTGRLFLHNGDGAYNAKNLAGSSTATDFSARAIDVMLIFKPASIRGLEAGGHYGFGKKDSVSAEMPDSDNDSYSAYAYYNPGIFQLKAEVISFTNNVTDMSTMGYYVFGGYDISENIELLGRYEIYDPNTDVDSDELSLITLGAALREFGNNNHRVTAAIVLSTNDATKVDDTIFQLIWQFVFKTK